MKVYREVLPTVVEIFTSSTMPTQQGMQEQRGLGTGVLISPECHVLTAAHVVVGTDSITVKTVDDSLRPAEILYSEPSADIALLRLVEPAPQLRHAKLGDSDRLAVGQSTYVIGTPYGFEHSFSAGHISGFRQFGRMYDGTVLLEFIQTDAAINSGSSGGPVFDSKGEVIGIASRIATQSGGFQGLGFVVAINTAKQLLAHEERPWLGIEAVFLDADLLARWLNVDAEGGLLIQHVARGSPADRAGLHGGTVPARIQGQDVLLGGDLILEFNTLEACHSECLIREGKRMDGLDRIPITFLRGGRRMQVLLDVSSTRRNFMKRPSGS